MKPRDLKGRRPGWWCACCNGPWSGQHSRREADRLAITDQDA